MAESISGPLAVTFRHQGHVIDWRCSLENVELDGIAVPKWIEHHRHGISGPDVVIRVEVRDGSPELVELSFQAQPNEGGIQEKHVRAVKTNKQAEDLYAALVADFSSNPTHGSEAYADVIRRAANFVEQQRLPREYRRLTDDVLRKVADVYRDNIRHAPTQAVAKHFGLQARMASTYVDRARKAGYLPSTNQGRKKA
jgi:hypothetical protein